MRGGTHPSRNPIMDNRLTILIPFRSGQAYINGLLATIPADIPVLVVDDNSPQPYLAPKQANVKSIRLEQRGYFSGAVNAGINAVEGDVLVLNQDTTFTDTRWLELIHANRDEFALIGDGVFGHPFLPLGYVQGTFMFMRRDALGAVGLLNEADYPLWGATAEWQVRAARRGYYAKPVRMEEYGFVHARGKEAYGSSIKATLNAQPEDFHQLIRTPPLVSVVITNYNYGRYLQDGVNSLIGGETCLGYTAGQTLQSFEVIIVDDGSTDDSAEIAKGLADPRKGVRFIQRTRGGSSASANTGIKQSLGKYITVLDADDMMEPTRLEKMVKLLEANPHSVVYDDLFWVQQREQGWLKTMVYELSGYEFEKMLTRNAMHKGILYPKQAWVEAGGYPETMKEGREDWAFNVALGVKGYCGVHLKEPLYLYRRHDKNRTRENTTPEWREYHMEQLHNLFPSVYAGERPMGCCGRSTNKPTNGSGGAAMQMARLNVGGNLMAVGSEGMVSLTYLLRRAGPQMYHGAVSKAPYTFGGSRTMGYVDARDVPAFLELREGTQKVFRLSPAPQGESAPPPSEPVVIPNTVPSGDKVMELAGVGIQAAGAVTAGDVEDDSPEGIENPDGDEDSQPEGVEDEDAEEEVRKPASAAKPKSGKSKSRSK